MMLFHYLYRDAGNFKAFGSVALKGSLTSDEMMLARSHLSGDGLFIAEQLGIPTLYEELYRWSGGPIASDHCWHEFVDILLIEKDHLSELYQWGSAHDFLDRLLAISSWNEELSPHFRLVAI